MCFQARGITPCMAPCAVCPLLINMHLNCLNDSFDKHSPFTQETKSSQRREAAGTGRTLAACGRASPPPCCQCKSPGAAEPGAGETGRVSARFPQAQEPGCACNHVCPRAAAFVGARLMGMHCRPELGARHPSIRTPGISAHSMSQMMCV